MNKTEVVEALEQTPTEKATVVDANGEPIGGIIVFVEDGRLSALEIYDWAGPGGISPLPQSDRLQLRRSRG